MIAGKTTIPGRRATSRLLLQENGPVIRLKVGVNRKEATDRDGSVGASCEVEVEIPGGATDAEVLRLRDRWLDFCETAVDEELDRLRGGPNGSGRRPAPAARADARAPDPTRGRRDARDDFGVPQDDRLAPTDGRQLLGWAAKQDPDAKGLVISFGKNKGYPPKIVDWDDDQVGAAYRYVRARQGR